ncbi:unnamed protein product [Owenia fusiformis]|uniref:Uncharacterized protein n=1 Tax=Owenia fusiformis TaxID=6347 RepID=A0A8J1UD04_OWEFU|nr:unnamed protein product [Owenia fusiformis]
MAANSPDNARNSTGYMLPIEMTHKPQISQTKEDNDVYTTLDETIDAYSNRKVTNRSQPEERVILKKGSSNKRGMLIVIAVIVILILLGVCLVTGMAVGGFFNGDQEGILDGLTGDITGLNKELVKLNNQTNLILDKLEHNLANQSKAQEDTKIDIPDPETDVSNPDTRNVPVGKDCLGQSNGLIIVQTRENRRFVARCEDEWLIIANRFDGSQSFELLWNSYKNGFGNILGEYFLGLDNIVSMLQQKRYKARFELTRWDNETETSAGEVRYAEYTTFDIRDETDKYRLNIDGYTGTAGDSMSASNHMQFTTKDNDNDKSSGNCAVYHLGPWWYGACGGQGSVFGTYSDGPICISGEYDCVTWYEWPENLIVNKTNEASSFKEMKIKLKPLF